MKELIQNEILLAYTRVGHKANEMSVNLIANDCMDWIAKNAKGMTPENVKEAFKKGAFKEYGDYMTISSVVVISWLVGYVKSYAARELIRNHKPVDRQLPSTGTKTEAEVKAEDEAFITQSKLRYKRSGKFHDYGNLLFKALVRQKHLVVDAELWESAKLRQIEAEKAEIKVLHAKSQIGKNKMAEMLAEITPEGVNREEYKIKHQVVNIWLAKNS
jgi:hypothetical protein